MGHPKDVKQRIQQTEQMQVSSGSVSFDDFVPNEKQQLWRQSGVLDKGESSNHFREKPQNNNTQ
jgi:hypothetical protein